MAATDFTALAYEGYDCLTVSTRPDAQSAYDDAEITLTNVTPAPTPAPDPGSDSRRRPTPTPAPLGPSPLTRAEKLEAALAKCTSAKCRTNARKRFGPTKREQSPRRAGPLQEHGVRAPRQGPLSRRQGRAEADRTRAQALRLRRQRRHGRAAAASAGRRSPSSTAATSTSACPEGAGVPELHAGDLRRARRRRAAPTYAVKGKTCTVAASDRRYTIGKDARARSPTGDETEPTTLERQVFPSAGSRWDVPEIEAIAIWGSALISQTVDQDAT